MKRTLILVAAIAVALATAGLAIASSRRAKVNLRSTKIGKVLVNARGFTLYEFALDKRNKDVCVTIPGCTTVWPLLTTSSKPIAGKGVRRSLLGTITLKSGRHQVTYAGHPLYTYIGDGSPGNTFGAGISQAGGRWYALSAGARRLSKK